MKYSTSGVARGIVGVGLQMKVADRGSYYRCAMVSELGPMWEFQVVSKCFKRPAIGLVHDRE